MTRTTNEILDAGDPFPALAGSTVAHGDIALPDLFEDGWGAFLVYRGHW